MLLTIAFIHYEGYLDLLESIQHLERIYYLLDNKYQSKIEILISDNCSQDREYLLKIINDTELKIKLIETDSYNMVDYNIFNVIKKSHSLYVWIFSVDDHINSVEHLIYIINILEYHRPDILVFDVALEHSILKTYPNISIKRSENINQAYNYIKGAGKISCGIYINKFNDKKMFSSLFEKFIGLGYLHLSYASLIYERNLGDIYHISSDIIVTNHKYNKKNLYHPKFAQTVDLAMATPLFLNNIPRLKYKINNSIEVKFYWTINLLIKRQICFWDYDMLNDFFNSIFFEFKNLQRKRILSIILMLISLSLLFFTFNLKLLKSSYAGLIGKRKIIKHLYIHGDIKS